MSVIVLSSAMAKMADRGRITANDVMALRHTVFASGISSNDEADVLIRLHNSCAPDIENWTLFFVDTLTSYIVYQTEPRGYVNAENADWLIEKLNRSGSIASRSSIDLLISIMSHARWAPPRLAAFALEQVKQSILDGTGPLSEDPSFEQGVIGRTQVDLIRRILSAYSGEQNIGISRAEAEVLMDLNKATSGQPNHRDWPELFMKAMSNYLLVSSGYKSPPRNDALRAEAWIGSGGSIQNLLTKMLSGAVRSFFETYHYASDDERAFARLELERIEMLLGEKVPAEERSWLIGQIGQDGELNENERALLALIKTEAPDLHPDLKPLLELVA